MGFLLSFAMGFSIASLPGPIVALIVTESLRRGAWSGSGAAIAPVFVDAVVMLPLVVILHASIPTGPAALAIGFAGGLFLLWLGVQALRSRNIDPAGSAGRNLSTTLPSFIKGVLTHLMNPYPYMFWGTVGLSYVRDGFQTGGLLGAIHFPLGFWLGASGFNFLVVLLVARGKRLLQAQAEPYFHLFSGLLLIIAGVFLIISVAVDQL